MADEIDLKGIIERLREAEAGGVFQRDTARLAAACIERAGRTLRVAIVGGDLDAATQVTNFFAGHRALPVDVGLTVMARLFHAEAERLTAAIGESKKKAYPIAERFDVLALHPDIVSIGMPLAALTKVTLLRVSVKEDGDALERATQAIAESDVVFWCTKSFDDRERGIWASFQRHTQDHGFLVVQDGSSIATADRELFRKVIVADVQRAEEIRSAARFDRGAFSQAGGTQLVKSLRSEITMANQAISDTAQFLLMRNAGTVPAEQPSFADDRPKPKEPTVGKEPSIGVKAIQHAAKDDTENSDGQPSLNACSPRGDINAVLDDVLNLMASGEQELAKLPHENKDDMLAWIERQFGLARQRLQAPDVSGSPQARALNVTLDEALEFVDALRKDQTQSACDDAARLALQVWREIKLQRAA
ncbi:MAG: hypothetical protein AAGJ74_12970 [Pseudomonadota bacterium]